MKRKWLILPIVLLVLVVALMVFYGVCSARLSVSYGEKGVLEQEQTDDEALLEAWRTVSDQTAACEDYWNNKWPEWFGGLGVVENEGEYLTNVYLTQDTEEHRKEVCEAAGASLRAYTATDVSWNQLRRGLKTVDSRKSLPGVNILSMGINMERRVLRVYLSHRDFLTTLALGTVHVPMEVVIVPVSPSVRSAIRNVDGTVTLELGGTTYSDRITLELSTDAAFEEEVKTVELPDNQAHVELPDPGEGETWYVRAKAFKEVQGTTYQSEWGSAKTVKDAG